MMEIGELAEYKELMLIAREQENIEEYKKFYDLFVSAYNEFFGKNFEDDMKNKI